MTATNRNVQRVATRWLKAMNRSVCVCVCVVWCVVRKKVYVCIWKKWLWLW